MSMKGPAQAQAQAQAPVAPGWLPDPMRLEPWEEQDEPLASERHHQEQDYCLFALRELLGPQGYVVTRDRWLRVDPTGVQRAVQPDLLIAHGVTLGPEETTYDPWLLGKVPDVLAEFLSPSTVTADLEGKPDWYARLGVGEYVRFDLSGIVLGGPPLAGFALTARGTWAPLPLDPDGGLTSRVLGVRFVWGEHLTILDVATGRSAPRFEEVMVLLRHAERARWAAEFERRREAEARQAAETAQQHAEVERRREAEARQAAEAAQRREAEARHAAEAEAARLRAELERLRQDPTG